MVSVVASSAVDTRFETLLGYTIKLGYVAFPLSTQL